MTLRTPIAPVAGLTILVLSVFPPRVAQTQDSAKPHVTVPTIDARPTDVSTLDQIVTAYYDVISGPAGQPRQWSRDRTLYWPGLRFFSAGAKRDGTPNVHVLTHQEYVDAT